MDNVKNSSVVKYVDFEDVLKKFGGKGEIKGLDKIVKIFLKLLKEK